MSSILVPHTGTSHTWNIYIYHMSCFSYYNDASTTNCSKNIIGLNGDRRIPIRPEVKQRHEALPSTVQPQMPVTTTKSITPIQANPRGREGVRHPTPRRGQAHSIIS